MTHPADLPARLAAATKALHTLAETVTGRAEEIDALMTAARADWEGKTADAFDLHHAAATAAAAKLADQLTALHATLRRETIARTN